MYDNDDDFNAFQATTLPPVKTRRLKSIRRRFEREYLRRYGAASGKGLYKETDWRRIEHAVHLVPTTAHSVLDVGVGPGALLNYLSLSRRLSRVTGIDTHRYTKFVALARNMDHRIMSVAKMNFPDNHFDVVFCMEVLEHLDTPTFDAAIPELRRVAKQRLVISVPYNEPLPLPAYHRQHFDAPRIRSCFGHADISLVYRDEKHSSWPWAVAVEDF